MVVLTLHLCLIFPLETNVCDVKSDHMTRKWNDFFLWKIMNVYISRNFFV